MGQKLQGADAGGPEEPAYSGSVLEVELWPELRDPVMVVAFTGWIDAGLAGAGSVAALIDQLEGARRFARIDLEEIADLQQTRPTVHLADGVTREIEWPAVDFVAGRAGGRDVVVCTGPEPSIRWNEFTTTIVETAARLGVEQALLLGGLPAAVSHRRPIKVMATATSHALIQDLGATRVDYNGPTGVQTVLQVALGDADIPAIGLWAEVPHYVAGNPSPPAIRALLERVRELAGMNLELGDFDGQAEEYAARVEEGLAERPDVAEMVRELDVVSETDLPTGDELASEIERFLREER
jgi:predicted ATP-grasp superfamily ATP-dependent carboligase